MTDRVERRGEEKKEEKRREEREPFVHLFSYWLVLAGTGTYYTPRREELMLMLTFNLTTHW